MLLIFGLLIVARRIEVGLDKPIDPNQLLSFYGKLCDCKRGTQLALISSYTRSIDCKDKTDFLNYYNSHTRRLEQKWICVNKPKPLPVLPNGQCSNNCSFVDKMHASCYSTFTTCLRDNQLYFIAIPIRK